MAHIAIGARVTASNQADDQTGTPAVDGRLDTTWSAGASAPQWIQIDLGSAQTITCVRLHVAQSPAGETLHQVLISPDASAWQRVLIPLEDPGFQPGSVLETPAFGKQNCLPWPCEADSIAGDVYVDDIRLVAGKPVQ